MKLKEHYEKQNEQNEKIYEQNEKIYKQRKSNTKHKIARPDISSTYSIKASK